MKQQNSSLMTRANLEWIGIDVVPATSGAAVETTKLGRKVRIEWTDLHRPTGARLFRVIWMGASHA